MSQQNEIDSRNLFQRLHAVMQQCTYLQREEKAGMKYKIVSHDAVTAYVRPELVANRVIYYPVDMIRTQEGSRTHIDITIRFVNIDNPSDFMDVKSCGYGIDPQDKGPGKAISYAVKYALLKALGLETGDDPDEQSIPHDPKAKPPPSAMEQKAQETVAASIKEGAELCKTLEQLQEFFGENNKHVYSLPDFLQDEVVFLILEKGIKLCPTRGRLRQFWESYSADIKSLPTILKSKIELAKDQRKAALLPPEPLQQAAE